MQEYILKIELQRHMLAESKNPPLCDFCSTPVAPQKDDPKDTIQVMARVRDHHISHVVCNQCRTQVVPDLDVVTGDEKPKSERALVDVLGKEPEVKTF